MLTDPVADLLTRLRNGAAAQKELVDIPASKLKTEIARILREEGYISGYEVVAPDAEHPGETLRVRLKYDDERRPIMIGLKRVSRPGRRHYVSREDIPRVQGGMGTTIISTSKGVMTGHDARREGVGGELVAQIW